MRSLRKWIRKLTRNQDGQGLTEYVIIVGLVAIATIAMVTIFGDNVRALFAASANALDGTKTTSTATNQVAGSKDERNIKDFAK